MGKTSPHINCYIVDEDKNECNPISSIHIEKNGRGTQ